MSNKQELITAWQTMRDKINREEELCKQSLSSVCGDNTREALIQRLRDEAWELYLEILKS